MIKVEKNSTCGVLIKKGAEAWLYLDEWLGFKVVRKVRVPKAYRDPALDLELRLHRTRMEAKLLREAKEAGVPTPTVFMVDLSRAELVMEFLEGPLLRDFLFKAEKSSVGFVMEKLGVFVGRLHVKGIIHGDLTTANVVVEEKLGIPFLIDFGLGFFSHSLEDKATEIYVLKKSLENIHFSLAKEAFEQFIKGYVSVTGEKEVKEILKRVKLIASRGRYKGGDKVW